MVSHDDMLDDLANIQHPNVKAEMRFPSVREEEREPARSNSEWNPYA